MQSPHPLAFLSLCPGYLKRKLDVVHNFKVTLYGNFAATVKSDHFLCQTAKQHFCSTFCTDYQSYKHLVKKHVSVTILFSAMMSAVYNTLFEWKTDKTHPWLKKEQWENPREGIQANFCSMPRRIQVLQIWSWQCVLYTLSTEARWVRINWLGPKYSQRFHWHLQVLRHWNVAFLHCLGSGMMLWWEKEASDTTVGWERNPAQTKALHRMPVHWGTLA